MLRAIAPVLLAAAHVIAQGNFPPPPTPTGNPHSPAKELLGMTLFFEEQLSSTSTVACASCHDMARGGADPRASASSNAGHDNLFGTADDQHGSPGIPLLWSNGELLPHPHNVFGASITSRRAPSVLNTGYHTHLLYDGSKASLEALIPGPLFNHVEMGHAGRTWAQVTQKLTAAVPLVFASNLPPRLQNFLSGRSYGDLFQLAYGTPTVTQQGIVQALATYLRTLNSDQSKWDLHLHGQAQLTAQEQLGLQLFNSPANGATSCNTCHADFDSRVLTEGPVVGQMTMTTSGPYGSFFPERLVFHNVGLRPPVEDQGRQNVTQASTDSGKFRVASLRNVELTGPYFHNGSASTIREALDFYDRGGDFHVNQAANLSVRNYTPAEKDALEALLRTLTDPRVAARSYPFDAPTLGSQNGRLVTTIGQGDATAAGRLVASAPFAPRLGESWFRLALSGATVGTPTFLMWDVAPSSGGLPFNLELALSPAFQLFGMGPAQSSWITPGKGLVQVPMPLPNLPALSGTTLYAQWLVLEPSAQWPLATSNALRIPLL